VQHGEIGRLPRLLDRPFFQRHFGFEDFALGRRQIEFDRGHHFAGAFAERPYRRACIRADRPNR
jgi:hypothetical protein